MCGPPALASCPRNSRLAFVMSDSVTAPVTVNGDHGLHLVPCSLIARTACSFACQMRIRTGSRTVDAKNIFDLMSLNAGKGTQLILEATGDDASEAIVAMSELFASGFDGHSRKAAT